MIEPATLSHAASVISSVDGSIPADAALRKYFYTHRHLGPRERRAASHAVFVYYRWLGWLDEGLSLQKRVAHALELQARFDHDPKSIKTEALAARAVPSWLREEMDLSPDFLRQLQRNPVLWLRARPGTVKRLAHDLGHCRIPPASADIPPDAVRYEGQQDLFLTPQFHAGAFEIQDLSSQWVAHLASLQPGETWGDLCAGEGGKTLHLADLMSNRGVIWATDRSARRLDTLRKRAARAKLFNIRVADKPPRGAIFDGILIDAPCSGVGTWRRNPHARWTATPTDVAELAAAQSHLLDDAAARLKPGGRLIYAVCTLTRSETTAVVARFAERHPDFLPLSSATWEPQTHDSNGMFITVWRRP